MGNLFSRVCETEEEWSVRLLFIFNHSQEVYEGALAAIECGIARPLELPSFPRFAEIEQRVVLWCNCQRADQDDDPLAMTACKGHFKNTTMETSRIMGGDLSPPDFIKYATIGEARPFKAPLEEHEDSFSFINRSPRYRAAMQRILAKVILRWRQPPTVLVMGRPSRRCMLQDNVSYPPLSEPILVSTHACVASRKGPCLPYCHNREAQRQLCLSNDDAWSRVGQRLTRNPLYRCTAWIDKHNHQTFWTRATRERHRRWCDAEGENYDSKRGGMYRIDCTWEGCGTGAVPGYECCTTHGGGVRCEKEGCGTRAVPGYQCCTKHGGGVKCKTEGCGTGARGSSGFCAKCMTRLKKASCEKSRTVSGHKRPPADPEREVFCVECKEMKCCCKNGV
jgi:hypothetical protein